MDEPDTCAGPHSCNASDSGSERKSCERNALRICLIGCLTEDDAVMRAAEKFGAEIVTADTGLELVEDKNFDNVFVVSDFFSPPFDTILKTGQRILGPPALKQFAERGENLPTHSRPLFNLAMRGVVVCFTGFRRKEEVMHLMKLIHHMGGSLRKDMNSKVTHLVANGCGGGKYQYAVAFRVPVMAESWIHACWASGIREQDESQHRLKPFCGAKVWFRGFSDDERRHMADVLRENGGQECEDGAGCTHVVVDSAETYLSLAHPPPSSSTPLSHAPASLLAEHNAATPPATPPARKPSSNQATPTRDEVAVNFATPFSKRNQSTPKRQAEETIAEEAGTAQEVAETPDFATPSVGAATPMETDDSFSDTGFATPARRTSFAVRRDPLRKSEGGARRLRLSMRVFGRGRKEGGASKEDEKRGGVTEEDCAVKGGGASTESHVTETQTLVLEPDLAGSELAGSDLAGSEAAIVRVEWFWVSVQNEGCADEKDYRLDNVRPIESIVSPRDTPGSARARKRKRLRDAARCSQSPAAHKRRSSVSDANLLSVSGSFLDTTDNDGKTGDEGESSAALTARQMVFLELVQTETNYVSILETIMSMFKSALEDSTPPLLSATELKHIFGNLPPIFELHSDMLEELRAAALRWREDVSVGQILNRYMSDLGKAYPPFINFFEATREALARCDAEKPRFHAFLKICQSRPECGRQSLQELLIRPVQRLPSVGLLLNDILKHTARSNPDHACLEQALSGIKEVMTHINEDKRKTESQLAMFDIFHEIDNCPPELLSSHRCLVSRVEATELAGGLANRGDSLALFLFTDVLEVCKRRGGGRGAGLGLRSPTVPGGGRTGAYKHVRLLPLPHIKRVIDVRETQACRRVFALVCRGAQELKERTFALSLSEEAGDKTTFLRLLCRQMANAVYKADAESFLMALDSSQLDVSLADVSTLGKAFKFASRTKLKVGRAFSFNKTPSKLKRAVSTMMGSPFVPPPAQLTPATQLAQMRLQASCSNLHELGKPEATQAPMSVQPTRRAIPGTQSLNAASLRRL